MLPAAAAFAITLAAALAAATALAVAMAAAATARALVADGGSGLSDAASSRWGVREEGGAALMPTPSPGLPALASLKGEEGGERGVLGSEDASKRGSWM